MLPAAFLTTHLSSFFIIVALIACKTANQKLQQSDVKQAPVFQQKLQNFSQAVFEKSHLYFGSEDRRSHDQQVTFPETIVPSQKVTLNFRLSCPNEHCDHWDRKGAIYIVTEENGQENLIEILRFITPYGVGMTRKIDVSYLLPLFKGTVTFRVFIDTSVGPGHGQGSGWLVDASLDFLNETGNQRPLGVLPIFNPESIAFGNPDKNPERRAEIEPQNLAAVSRGELQVLITGHGQGNTENCAEFCPKKHVIEIGKQRFSKVIWRKNCGETATDDLQKGTWRYSRAGWCPGDIVISWKIPIKTLHEVKTIRWFPEEYINLKSEGESGSHTPPHYELSALLIWYE